jgi:magnesium-transporting ATPase (P-type)
MATCQSTKHIGEKLIGNPHDIKIFEYIGWEQRDRLNDKNGYAYSIVTPSEKNLQEDKETNRKYREGKIEIKIFKQFEFQSKLQRMSVICIDQD